MKAVSTGKIPFSRTWITFETSEQLVLYRKGNSFMICCCGFLMVTHSTTDLGALAALPGSIFSQPRVNSHKYLKMDTITIEGIRIKALYHIISYSKYFCLHACTHIHMQINLTVWRPLADKKNGLLNCFFIQFFK